MKNALLAVLAATGILIVGFTPSRKADDASTFLEEVAA